MKRALWTVANAIQATFTVLWSAFWITVAIVLWILTLGNRRISFWMARRVWAPGLLLGAGARLRVEGLSNADFSQPVLVVANHQSVIDVAVLYAVLPARLRFVAKKELAWVPFLGWYVAAMGMIFVNRADRRRALTVVRKVTDRLRGDATVLSFAEGTRSREGEVRRFKRGGFLAAILAGVPVVPIAIEGAVRVLPPGGFRVRPGWIQVKVGRPLTTEGLVEGDREALATEAEETIRGFYEELRRRREG